MQRKLLALAVAGAFVVPGAAMAQVTISGSVRYSVDSARWNDGSTAGSGVSKWGVTGHSNNIKFTSRESLGGGMTAWGSMEAGFDSTRANAQNYAWSGRNNGAGLDTSWGTVMAGLWDSPYKSLDGSWSIGTPAGYSYSATAPIFGNGDTTGTHPNPNCTVNETANGYIIAAVPATVCGNSAGSATSFQRRLTDTFQYWSPVWNGVQLLVGTQGTNEKASAQGTVARADPSLWSYGLRWTGPRWALVVGHERHKNYNLNAAGTNRSSKDTGTKIGGNYNFGPVQVSLAWERIRLQLGTVAAPTDLRHKNTYIGLAIPVGNGAVRAAYSRGSVSGSAAPAAGGNGRVTNLSYEHNMSKRTLLYVAYAKLSQDAGSARQWGTNLTATNGYTGANLAGQDPRYLSFGMNHNF